MMSCPSFQYSLTTEASKLFQPSDMWWLYLQSLQEIQLDFDLMQVVSSPTRVVGSSSSTIDLILLSSVNYLDSWYPVSHASVHLTLTLPSKKRRLRPPTKSVWIYKSANLPLAKELLSNLPVASPSDDIDEFWRSWQRSFLSIVFLGGQSPYCRILHGH